MKTTEELLNKKLSIYTDLDTILDTRAVIAANLDPMSVIPFIESYKYIYRVKDNMGNISHDIFRSYYDRRDSSCLPHAPPTAILSFIKDQYSDIAHDIKNSKHEEELTLYLNIYPYKLTKEEIENVMNLVITQVPDISVQIIYMSWNMLTPIWVKEHVGSMFMYDLPYWIEYHMQNGNLTKTFLLNIMGVAPSLANNNTLGIKIDENYFKDFQKMLTYIMEYYPLAAKYFSGVLFYDSDLNKKEQNSK